MTTENQADLSTAQNNATKTESTSTPFDTQKIADIIGKSFLSGEESSEGSASEENAELEGQATSTDNVHSQQTEETNDSDSTEDSEETEETKSEREETERGLPKGVKKRIDKLTAKKREAESEVERLRSEVERLSQEAERPAQTPTKDNPFAHIKTIGDIQKEIEQAKQIRRWCEMNPDGAIVRNNQGDDVEYSAEEVRNIKIKSMDALEEHLPKRANYLQASEQFEQLANKDYVWWKDRSSRERQMAESFITAFPEILRAPDHKLMLGHLITGIKTYESTKRSSSPQKAPMQPRSSSAPTKVSSNDAKAQQAKQRFSNSGNRDDLSSIIANRFL